MWKDVSYLLAQILSLRTRKLRLFQCSSNMKAPDWLQTSCKDNYGRISVFYTCYCEYLHFIALLHSGIKIVRSCNSIDTLNTLRKFWYKVWFFNMFSEQSRDHSNLASVIKANYLNKNEYIHRICEQKESNEVKEISVLSPSSCFIFVAQPLVLVIVEGLLTNSSITIWLLLCIELIL